MLLNGNPLVAFVAGAALMFVEVQLLALVAKGLDKFPGIVKWVNIFVQQ